FDLAVEAMRRGAKDFIQKPWENARLLSILRTQIELSHALRKGLRLEAENRALRDQTQPNLIAESPAMKSILDVIARVGPSSAQVLITGENGSGKGVIAQAVHAASGRAARTMVTVNAGGLSEGIFESELFGHMRGAFTDAKTDRVGRFELADGGTLFLDEIANVPLNLQTKLLRVLETGDFERVGSSRTRHVNVRIVSATNSNLAEEVGAGRFRQDLLFRLNTIEIQLPPLRERREDIPALATHFLKQHAQRYRKNLTGFEPAALQALLDHPWPGNIRELDHAIERGVLMAQTGTIRVGELGLRIDHGILLLALAAGLPAALVALVLLWTGAYTPKVQWTLTVFIIGVWTGCSFSVRHRVVLPLQTLSNLLAALRESDFSIRARGASGPGTVKDDPLGAVLLEVNVLASMLHDQRLGALEAGALLRTVMVEIDVAVFTFDGTQTLRLVNRAGERLLRQSVDQLLGRTAAELGLRDCLDGPTPRIADATFPGGAGRWEVRRTTFRQEGR